MNEIFPPVMTNTSTPTGTTPPPHQLSVTWATPPCGSSEKEFKTKPATPVPGAIAAGAGSAASSSSGVGIEFNEIAVRKRSPEEKSTEFTLSYAAGNLASPVTEAFIDFPLHRHYEDYNQSPGYSIHTSNTDNNDDENDDNVDDEEDYSVSVSAIMQRRASVRGYRRKSSSRNSRRASSPMDHVLDNAERRRSSVYTTSSDEGTNQESTQEQIFENIRLHKEVIQSVKLQPWPIRKKLKLVRQAKTYVARHEGALQERFAMSRSTRDLWARFKIVMAARWRHWKREIYSFLTVLIPWELRIKEIESHFGSGVASYFTFLRWLMYMNVMIALPLVLFVIGPEYFGTRNNEIDPRKKMTEREQQVAGNLLTIWEFEGYLKYSPMFYGYYSSSTGAASHGYLLPLAYFLTAVVVYIYSFVATLRKMAENSRNSKLSSKDDECTFSWKLFTGWDFMIGHAETAHNRIASVVVGFKEALLEEAEKKKDTRNWRIIMQRIIVNILIIALLVASGAIVVYLVNQSEDLAKSDDWLSKNAVNVTMNLLSFILPMIFEALGLFENWHPRQQLRLQLARIMILNLLTLYSLMFSFIYKIDQKEGPLVTMKLLNDSVTAELHALNIKWDKFRNMTNMTTSSVISATTEAAIAATTKAVKLYNCRNVTMKCSLPFTVPGILPKTTTATAMAAAATTLIMLNLTSTTRMPAIDKVPNYTIASELTTEAETTPFLARWTTLPPVADTTEATTQYATRTTLFDSNYSTTLELEGSTATPTNANSQLTTESTKPPSSDEDDISSTITTVLASSTTTEYPGNDTLFEYYDYFAGMSVESPLAEDEVTPNDLQDKRKRALKGRKRRRKNRPSKTTESLNEVFKTTLQPEREKIPKKNKGKFKAANVKKAKGKATSLLLKRSKYSRRDIQEDSGVAETYTTSISTLKTDESPTTSTPLTTADPDPDSASDFTIPTDAVNPLSTTSSDFAILLTESTTLDSNAPLTEPTTLDPSTPLIEPATPDSSTPSPTEPTTLDSSTPPTTASSNFSSPLKTTISKQKEVFDYFTTTERTSPTNMMPSGEDQLYNLGDLTTTPFYIEEEGQELLPTALYNLDQFPPGTMQSCRVMQCLLHPPHDGDNQTMITMLINDTKQYTLAEFNTQFIDIKRRLKAIELNLTTMCWETSLGQELSKVVVLDGITATVLSLVIDFLRALFVRYVNRNWCWDMEKTFPQYGDFKIAENILGLINNQGQVWMGIFFSPGIVIINLVKLVIMMYFRSWIVLTCNVPHEVVFKASKSNNFYLSLLLTMLFLCVLPVAYAIVWLRPSWHCGPYSEFNTTSEYITNITMKALPEDLHRPLKYMASASTVIPMLLLLILIIYYLVSLTGALREANQDLKTQLQKEREEERKKFFQVPEIKPSENSSTTMTNRWRKVLEASSPVSPTAQPDFESEEYKNQARKELISRIMKKALRKDSATSDEETFARQHGRDDDTDTEHHDSLPHDEDGNERRPALSKLQEIRRTRKPSLVDIVQIANSERERVKSLRKQALGNGGKGKAKGERGEKKSPPPPGEDVENEKNRENDNGNDPEIKTRVINERRQSLLRKKKEDEANEKEPEKERDIIKGKEGGSHKEKHKRKEDEANGKGADEENEKDDDINRENRKKKENEANGKEADKTSDKGNGKEEHKGNGKEKHKGNGNSGKDKHKGNEKENGKEKHKENGNGKEKHKENGNEKEKHKVNEYEKEKHKENANEKVWIKDNHKETEKRKESGKDKQKEKENCKEKNKEEENHKEKSNGNGIEIEKRKGSKNGNEKDKDHHTNELDKEKENEKNKSKDKDHDKKKEKENEGSDNAKNDNLITHEMDKDKDKPKEGAIKHRIYESFRRKKREDKDKVPSKQSSLEKTNEEETNVDNEVQPSPNRDDDKKASNKRRSPKMATTPDESSKSDKSSYKIVDEKSPKLHEEKQTSPPVLEQLQNLGGKLKFKRHKQKPSTEPEVFKFDQDKVNKEADIATTPTWQHLESELQSPRVLEDVITPNSHKHHLGADKFANISRQSRKKIGSFLNLMKDAVTRPEHEHHSDTAIDIPSTPRLELSSAFNNAFMLPVAMHTTANTTTTPTTPSPTPSPNVITTTTPSSTNNSIQPYIMPRAPLEIPEDIDPPSYHHLMMSANETHIVSSKDPEELDKPGPIIFQQRSISQRRRPIRQDSQSSNWSADNIPTITISATPETEEPAKSPNVTSTGGVPITPRPVPPKVNVIKINIEQDK